MTHRDAGREFARPRSSPPERRQMRRGEGVAAIAAAARVPEPYPPAPARSAPHVKRAHRAVFARFALSLRAVIRQRGTGGEVPA